MHSCRGRGNFHGQARDNSYANQNKQGQYNNNDERYFKGTMVEDQWKSLVISLVLNGQLCPQESTVDCGPVYREIAVKWLMRT